MPSRNESFSFSAMGTLASVSWGSQADLAADWETKIRSRCESLEQYLSRFRADSEIAILDEKWREVSSDTATVLLAADLLRKQTDGWFNPLLGKQVQDWEDAVLKAEERWNDPNTFGVPEVPAGQSAVGRIQVKGRRARLIEVLFAAKVDLGGIAKGYAADQLRDLAIELGIVDPLVSLGSSSIAVGEVPAKVGLTSPWVGQDRLGTLTLPAGFSLSMSADPGTMIRTGKGYSHVFDPSLGSPAVTDLCAVVVCGEDGMMCEAFSTAYLAMGLDQALALDVKYPQLQTLFMTIDGRLFADPLLQITLLPGTQQWLRENQTA